MRFTTEECLHFDRQWLSWPRKRLWHWRFLGCEAETPNYTERAAVYHEIDDLLTQGLSGRPLRDALRSRLERRGFSPLLILSVMSVLIQLVRLIHEWRNNR